MSSEASTPQSQSPISTPKSTSTSSTSSSPPTTSDAIKDATAFVTEATTLPTTTSAPLHQKARSHTLLLVLVIGLVFLCWFFGFELFQTSSSTSYTELLVILGSVSAVLIGLLVWTGTHTLDFWELVMRWGWYTVPAVGAAGVLFVVMQERTEEMGSVD